MNVGIIVTFYAFAFIALAISTAAIYMALIEKFPVHWLYYHYFIRKPIVWIIFGGSSIWFYWLSSQTGELPIWMIVPLFLMGLSVILTYKMHQENAFKAVDFPNMAKNISELPLNDDMQLGVIEYGGESKAYPLDYVIHHHIINDHFGEFTVSLTYCAMCRSIIPFDVTDIGPLFVGSFKNANLIVADRKTKTFFQQATFESLIGKLHPKTLKMISFQILPWSEVKRLNPIPQIVKVTNKDFREFQLPVPGIWKKITAREITPGLSAKNRDKTFPARTHVIGIIDPVISTEVVYLKEELQDKGIIKNEELDVFFVTIKNTVLCFKNSLKDKSLDITLNPDNTLSDTVSGTVWNLQGKNIKGDLKSDLTHIAISDEYWFSWKKFHPESTLIRV